jgi:hypothetical protein
MVCHEISIVTGTTGVNTDMATEITCFHRSPGSGYTIIDHGMKKGVVMRALIFTGILLVLCGGVHAAQPVWTASAGDEIRDLSISDDGTTILAVSDNIYLLSSEGEVLAGYGGVSGSVSSDGSSVAIGSGSGVQSYSRTGGSLWNYDIPHISAVDASGDSDRTVAATTDGEMLIFDRGGHVVGTNHTLKWAGVAIPLSGIAVSDDGRITYATCGGGILAYDQNGTGIWKVSAVPRSLSLSRSGSLIAYGSEKSVVALTSGGNLSWTNKTGGEVSSVSISPDGSYVASSSGDQHITLFGPGGRVILDYISPVPVKCVAISPDGQYIAAGLMNRTLFVMNSSGEVLWSYQAEGVVNIAHITGAGPILVAGTNNGKVMSFPLKGDEAAAPVLTPVLIEETEQPVPITTTSETITTEEIGTLFPVSSQSPAGTETIGEYLSTTRSPLSLEVSCAAVFMGIICWCMMRREK